MGFVWLAWIGLVASIGLLMWVLTRQKTLRTRYLFAALVLVAGLRLIPIAASPTEFFVAHPRLALLPFDLSWLLGPLLYLCAAEISGKRPSPRLAIALASLQSCCRIALAIQPGRAIERLADWIRWAILLERFIAIALGAIFLARSIQILRSHRQKWPFRVLIAGVVSYGIGLIFGILYWAVPQAAHTPVPMLNLLASWIPLAFVASYLYPDPAKTTKPIDDELQATAEKIAQRIEELELWRDPELTLASLSKSLGHSQGAISRALNQGLGKGFSEFINRRRVEAVCETILIDNRDFFILAMECGFSSKASFNRCFREVTGMSPTEYKRRYKENPIGRSEK